MQNGNHFLNYFSHKKPKFPIIIKKKSLTNLFISFQVTIEFFLVFVLISRVKNLLFYYLAYQVFVFYDDDDNDHVGDFIYCINMDVLVEDIEDRSGFFVNGLKADCEGVCLGRLSLICGLDRVGRGHRVRYFQNNDTLFYLNNCSFEQQEKQIVFYSNVAI
jgi:hypothetical protein